MSLHYRTLAKTTPPNAIAGLLAWWKSDAGITLVSGAVDSWADQSGNSHTASAAASTNRPAYSTVINGKTVLTFDGSSDYLTANALATHLNGNDTPFTVMFSAKPTTTSPATNMILFAPGQSTSVNYFHIVGYRTTGYIISQRRAVNSGDQVIVDSSPTSYTTTMAVVSMVFTGTAVSIYINGTVVVNNVAMNVGSMASNFNRVGIGALVRSAVENYFSGDLGEVIVYNSAISTTDRSAVEFYLKSRWL